MYRPASVEMSTELELNPSCDVPVLLLLLLPTTTTINNDNTNTNTSTTTSTPRWLLGHHQGARVLASALAVAVAVVAVVAAVAVVVVVVVVDTVITQHARRPHGAPDTCRERCIVSDDSIVGTTCVVLEHVFNICLHTLRGTRLLLLAALHAGSTMARDPRRPGRRAAPTTSAASPRRRGPGL